MTPTGRRFVLAGVVSLLAWVLLQSFAPGAAIPWTGTMQEAARRMERALVATSAHCAEMGIEVDRLLDPNGTCLIGPELSELFTSLGQLEAKRTTTNPDMAGLIVHLLEEAGVGKGDRVAVGSSGSFPALLVATLAAIDALEIQPVVTLSLGASSYGATRPDFHLLDLHGLLLEEGIVATTPAAVSLGGSGDVGEEFDPEFREALVQELRAGEPPFLKEPDLQANVAWRMGIYLGDGGGSGPDDELSGPVAAFVNVGGAEVNLGTHARVLSVPPGLSIDLASRLEPPPLDQRGVLFEMAARGVPVIHLLNLRGLALRYGLPWDPLPLPSAGTTELRDTTRGKGGLFWLLTAAYLGALALVALIPDPMRQPR